VDEALARFADAVRRLVDATVSVAASPDALRRATESVDRISAELRLFVPTPLPPRFPYPPWSADPGEFFPYDVVLGKLNPLAAPVHFTWEDPKAIGRVRFRTPYEGPPGCVHGGVLAACFDQVFNVANVMRGVAGPTVRLEIRYRRPTPLFDEVRFEGWQERVEGKRIHATGRALVGEEVTAEAHGVFVQLPPERVMRMLAPRS
jgi:acyl-coenzyme A thioesterase PaaI-like protein